MGGYVTLYNFKYHKMSLIKVSWYGLRVKNMHKKFFGITSLVFLPPRSGHFLVHLNNYFRLHVCLSFRPSVRPSVTLYDFKSYHKMSLIKVSWYVIRVKNMHLKKLKSPSRVFRSPGPPGGARQCPRSGHFLVIKNFIRK